jgi:hypothetical protein
MGATRYAIADLVVETPRYGGGGEGLGAGVEHDLVGHGWVEIERDAITIHVHPRGVVGRLEPNEKRTYALRDISAWGTDGGAITFGVGRIGLFAANGAEAPVHSCQMKCDDAAAARRLTEEAVAAGLKTGTDRPFHSGI